MKKILLGLTLLAFSVNAQEKLSSAEVVTLTKSKTNFKANKSPFAKAGTNSACGQDTLRYTDNKAYYLQSSYSYGSLRMSNPARIFTTSFKMNSTSTYVVKGVEIWAKVRRYNGTTASDLPADTIHNTKVYIFNLDANGKPEFESNGKALDSADIVIGSLFKAYYASFTNPVTITGKNGFAIGLKASTTAAGNYVYIYTNQIDAKNASASAWGGASALKYGENLTYAYSASGPNGAGFYDLATWYGNANLDAECIISPIGERKFTADLTNTKSESCDAFTNTLTNTSVGSEIVENAQFDLISFGRKFNIPTSGSKSIKQDSVYTFLSSVGGFDQFNTKASAPDPFTTSATAGVYGDTLSIFSVSHDFNVCYTDKILTYEIKDCSGIDELTNALGLVYPNPANNELNIELTNNATITLTSTEGKVIETRNASKGVEKFNVSELKSGVYFVTINNGITSTVEKVTIK